MTNVWRCLSLFGAMATLFAGALTPSHLSGADGPSAAETKPIEAKPSIAAKPSVATKPDASVGKASQNFKSNAAARAERTVAVAKAHAATTKLTADREAAAVAFASQNHPELATLLSNLKQNNPSEYHAAVVELDRIVERLAAMKPKNSQQHDSALALWKMDSRIRLLAARLTMSDNPALEAELKAAIREKVELTLNERKAERDRLQKRVEKLDQTIGELSTKLDDVAEKEFAAVKRTAQSSKPTTKPKPVKKGEENAIAKPVERTTNNKDKSGAKAPLKEPKSK